MSLSRPTESKLLGEAVHKFAMLFVAFAMPACAIGCAAGINQKYSEQRADFQAEISVLLDHVHPSLLSIESVDGDRITHGTGLAIQLADGQTAVVTAAHIARNGLVSVENSSIAEQLDIILPGIPPDEESPFISRDLMILSIAWEHPLVIAAVDAPVPNYNYSDLVVVGFLDSDQIGRSLRSTHGIHTERALVSFSGPAKTAGDVCGDPKNTLGSSVLFVRVDRPEELSLRGLSGSPVFAFNIKHKQFELVGVYVGTWTCPWPFNNTIYAMIVPVPREAVGLFPGQSVIPTREQNP